MMRRCVSLILLSIACTAPASAQAPVAADTSWQDGFVVTSRGGAARLVFGLVAQLDGRFAADDDTEVSDPIKVRRLRPTIAGRATRYFEFKVTPDFGNGTAVVQDAFVDVRVRPGLRIRAGKDKTPIGYELLQPDMSLLLPERALASSLVPNRDLGVQVQGDVGPMLAFAAGVFNGIPDGTSAIGDVHSNAGQEVAGRVVVHPFTASAGVPALAGLGVHLGASVGPQSGLLPTFRSFAGQPYFSYARDAAATGQRRRIAPAVFYYRKAIGVFGEYVRSTQPVTRTGTTTPVRNDAWEATASYVLTGEAASERGVRPRRPFNPSAGQWGAVQIVARRSHLDVDPAAFASGLAGPGASRRAHETVVGVNWYPTAFLKGYAAFEHTEFHGGTARPHENAVVVRGQVAF